MSDVMADETAYADELRAELPESVVRTTEPLARRTTLRAGGPADLYVEPASENDLARLIRFCAERNLPYLILGRGSNLLIRDGGIRGVVISMAHPSFANIEVFGRQLRCGAGAKLKDVAVRARKAELTGLEFLEGIPGSVGGALRMNAGAMGGATFDVVTQVRFMDDTGDVRELSAASMNAGYRSCPFLATGVALGATFAGEPAPKELIMARTNDFNERRWRSQPKEPSAGCVFKNPSPTLSAGKLLDDAGLKGARIGGASVSMVHANFIINDGTATAHDILELIEMMRARVKAAHGLELRTEVQVVGDDP